MGEYKIVAKGLKNYHFRNETPLNFRKNDIRGVLEVDHFDKFYEFGSIVKFRLFLFERDYSAPNIKKEQITVELTNSYGYVMKDVQLEEIFQGVFIGSVHLPVAIPAMELGGAGPITDWKVNAKIDDIIIKEMEETRLIVENIYPNYCKVSLEAPEEVSMNQPLTKIQVKANFIDGHPLGSHVILNIRPTLHSKSQKDEKPQSYTLEQDMIEGNVLFDLDISSYKKFFDKDTKSIELGISAHLTGFHTYFEAEVYKRVTVYLNSYKVKTIDVNYMDYYEPNKVQDRFYLITYLNGSLIEDRTKMVTLVYTQEIVYQKYPLDAPQPDEESTALARSTKLQKFRFFSYLKKNGECTFKILLPELANIKGYKNQFRTKIIFDGEEHDSLIVRKNGADDFNSDDETPYSDLIPKKRKSLSIIKNSTDVFVSNVCDLTIISTIPMQYIVHILTTKENVLRSERTDFQNQTNKCNITLDITSEMFPYFNIYVYFVDVEGSLHHAELHIPVRFKTFQNKLEVIAPTESEPGEVITLKIKTAPNSVLSIWANDQRYTRHPNIYLEGHDSFENQIKKLMVWKPFQEYQSYHPGSDSDVITLTNAHYNFTYQKYRNHENYYTPRVENYFQILQSKDLKMEEEIPSTNIRSHFPLSFEFTTLQSSENGEIEWEVKVPDSITKWSIVITSWNRDLSIGVAKKLIELNVTKKLYLDVTLPRANILRDNELEIRVRVVNDFNSELDVEVFLKKNSDHFDIIGSADDEEIGFKTIHVKASSYNGVVYKIQPKIVGTIKLVISAKSSIASDFVQTRIMVIPEGTFVPPAKAHMPTYIIDTYRQSEFRETYVPNLPENVIPHSHRLFVHINCDLMQLVFNIPLREISDTEKTGEYIMTQYLFNYCHKEFDKIKNKLLPIEKVKLNKKVELNYQELMSYRLADGSFKMHYKEDTGSIWLTAYVLYSIPEGSEVVEEKIIEEGLDFLAKRQAADGSFEDTINSTIISALDRNTLTAYVLLIFIEKDHSGKHSGVFKKCMKFLEDQQPYSSAEAQAIFEIAKIKYQKWTSKVDFRRMILDADSIRSNSICPTYKDYFAQIASLIRIMLANYHFNDDMVIEIQTQGIEPINHLVHVNKESSDAFMLETPYGTKSISFRVKGFALAMVDVSFSYHNNTPAEKLNVVMLYT